MTTPKDLKHELDPSRQSFHDVPVAEDVALYGAPSLSNVQIIETMLDSTTPSRAEQLLIASGGIGNLVSMTPFELMAFGLNKAEMARFAVLQEVGRRVHRGGQIRPRIVSPSTAAAYLMPQVQGWTEERFGILALDARGGLLADHILAQGTPTACLITPREFFREALRLGAITAIAYHNHPSGDPTPSREDANLTRRLRVLGIALNVPCGDHLVLGHSEWHSFRVTEAWDSEPVSELLTADAHRSGE